MRFPRPVMAALQSARSVWRQSCLMYPVAAAISRCNLHGACGGKGATDKSVTIQTGVAICTERVEAKARRSVAYSTCFSLQSARSVWRQRHYITEITLITLVAICTERVEAKALLRAAFAAAPACCNLHGACGGKEARHTHHLSRIRLQSARSVWRQRPFAPPSSRPSAVAICTERVEAKRLLFVVRVQRHNVAICTERVEAKSTD